ncbi:MAG TPA: 5'-nucleotidase C-terminal domain-containing protein [Clostridia bacterium]|nr:5'-nucleotidase C-terminal domain-containing protein [Clostridia bacterium]
MKKYINIIVLGIIAVSALVYLVAKTVNIQDVFLDVGIYDRKISVISTADIHGHVLYDEEIGYYSLDTTKNVVGMPILRTLADTVKKNNKDTLMLDSGDMFHGTNEANIEKGKGIVEIANLMGYTAMTIGNHDFNFGLDRLKEIKSQLNYPILSANILENGKPLFGEYKIIDMDGLKVGLFGLTQEEALAYTNSRDLKNVSIENAVTVAKKIVPELKKSCDVVILMSHLGEERDIDLAEKVDGIDLVLCGHHHYLFPKAKKVGNTYMGEAGGSATHIGIADIYLKNGKVQKILWRVETTSDKSKADKEANTIAQQYFKIAYETQKEIVGKADVRLNGLRFDVRSKETNLGNLLADAMKEEGKADITLMNGGGIRQSIPKGDISLYTIGNTLPFYNFLVTIELKGDTIYKAIENGLRSYPSGMYNGAFLQVSGISFEFDASKIAGKRLQKVLKDGVPLDRDRIYKVATNDYLYNGGDGYDCLKDAKLIYNGRLLKDVLADYIKKMKTVSPSLEGRIKVINEKYK